MALLSIYRRAEARAAVVLLWLVLGAGCRFVRAPSNSEIDFNRGLAAAVKSAGRDVPGFDYRGIPRYPKSRRLVCRRPTAGGDRWYYAAYRAPASLPSVSKFYKKKLPAGGWRLEMGDDAWRTYFYRRRVNQRLSAQLIFRPLTVRGKPATLIIVIVRKNF